jgi:periplasmic protein TonB
MLSTLIESRRTRSGSRGATTISVIAHAVAITFVAAITAHVGDRSAAAAPVPHDIVYIHTAEPTPSHEQSSPVNQQAPSQPKIPTLPFTHVEVPTTIPSGIPPVDLSVPPIDLSQLAIGGAKNSSTIGTSGPTANGGSSTYSAWQVEKAVVPLAGNPKPAYPSMLQSGRVEGEVLAQFVVDTTGRVDMSSFRAIQATNELFVQSVRRALAGWRFRPAEVEGRKVRQLVQMPLTFRVR